MFDAPWSGSATPFSFVYGGRPSAELLPGWDLRESRDGAAGGSLRVLTWRDSRTRLRLTAKVRTFDHPAATEWLLELANDGTDDTPLITDLLALDATAPLDAEARTTIHRARGSLCQVDDFLPVDDDLGPGKTREYVPVGGRSSNGVLPFMNIEVGRKLGRQAHGGFATPPVEPSGFVLGIGWSGQWMARFRREEGTLRASAGLEHLSLRLRPGESIRTPRALVVPWRGPDRFTGNNLLRRLILERYTPRDPRGEPHVPPIAHMRQLVYYFIGQVTEADHLAAVERARELGIEAFWVDALWYGGGSGDGVDWATQVGTWNIRRDRFPRGLKPVADAAHARGMKFVLWFEPERVFAGSEIAREHPEFLLRRPGDEKTCLLDLGNPAARLHVLELVSGMIASEGIDVYRQDFNMDPLAY